MEKRQYHTSWKTSSGLLFLLGGKNHSTVTTTMINDRRNASEAGFNLRNKIRSVSLYTSKLDTSKFSKGPIALNINNAICAHLILGTCDLIG